MEMSVPLYDGQDVLLLRVYSDIKTIIGKGTTEWMKGIDLLWYTRTMQICRNKTHLMNIENMLTL